MNYTMLCIAVIVGIGSLAAAQRSKRRDGSEGAQKSDIQKREAFESILAPGEELVGFCPNDRKNRYYCALTQNRLYIETKKGIVIIPLEDVKKIICCNFAGEKTNLVEDTFRVTVKADRTYQIYRYSGSFYNFVEHLRYRCPT